MAFIKSLGRWDSVTFPINITEYRGGASRLVDMIITFPTVLTRPYQGKKERSFLFNFKQDRGSSGVQFRAEDTDTLPDCLLSVRSHKTLKIQTNQLSNLSPSSQPQPPGPSGFNLHKTCLFCCFVIKQVKRRADWLQL